MTREEAIDILITCVVRPDPDSGGYYVPAQVFPSGSAGEQAIRLLKDTRHKAHAVGRDCPRCGGPQSRGICNAANSCTWTHDDGWGAGAGPDKGTPVDESVNPDADTTAPHSYVYDIAAAKVLLDQLYKSMDCPACPHCKNTGQVVSLYSTEPCPAGCAVPKARGW